MKKFLVLLSLLFSSFTYADTINLHWLNEDGTVYENSTCVIDSDLILPATPPTKYGYTFTGWKMTNYIPVEYLESTGTQYIDTNYIPNANTRIVAKYYMIYNSSSVLYPMIFGVSNGLRLPQFSSYIYNGVYYYTFGRYGSSDNDIKITTTTYDYLHTIDCNKNVFTLDNIIVTGNSNSDVRIQYPLYIFCRNETNSLTTNCSNMKLYEFKIWDNSTLVRDFIPVLDENNIPCMFDKVEGKFYYNAGSGEFIAGPAL